MHVFPPCQYGQISYGIIATVWSNAAEPPSTLLADWLVQLVDIHHRRHPAGWKYCCVEELVLDRGQSGEVVALTAGAEYGVEGRCYANAALYATIHDVTYVEGFAMFENGMVTAHAWCFDPIGQVHDPTWPIGSGLAYLGIPYADDYIQSFNERVGNACLRHDPHVDNFSLLKSGLPPNAVTSSAATSKEALPARLR